MWSGRSSQKPWKILFLKSQGLLPIRIWEKFLWNHIVNQELNSLQFDLVCERNYLRMLSQAWGCSIKRLYNQFLRIQTLSAIYGHLDSEIESLSHGVRRDKLSQIDSLPTFYGEWRKIIPKINLLSTAMVYFTTDGHDTWRKRQEAHPRHLLNKLSHLSATLCPPRAGWVMDSYI